MIKLNAFTFAWLFFDPTSVAYVQNTEIKILIITTVNPLI